MRWTLVSSRHHPGQGGIGASVAAFIEGATDAGWQIDLITKRSDCLPRKATIHLVRTLDDDPAFSSRIEGLRQIDRIRPYRYGLWALALVEYLRKNSIETDVIEFVDVQAEGYVALRSGAVRRVQKNVPMIIQAHTPMYLAESLSGMETNRFGRSIYHAWEREALKAADGVFGPSRLILDELGMDVQGAVIAPVVKAVSPRNETPRDQTLLLVGYAEPRKGVETWARSLNIVLNQHPDATALFVGPDTPTAPDGNSYFNYCTGMIDPSLRQRFQFLGPQKHADTLRCIAGASLVVVPSLFESFSIVVAEAIMRGVPVVLSDRVGIVEHVSDLETFPVGDASALADLQLGILHREKDAGARSLRHRDQLLKACSREANLKGREAFVRSLKEPDLATIPDMDAEDEMRRCLDEIERQEPMPVGGGKDLVTR